ncbi:hypothetical protein C0J52_02624 [Blattella germanica]|nr:hypothetical protein C0J52_02624 [Blattella germanica]
MHLLLKAIFKGQKGGKVVQSDIRKPCFQLMVVQLFNMKQFMLFLMCWSRYYYCVCNINNVRHKVIKLLIFKKSFF